MKFVVELNRKSILSLWNLVSENYSLAAKMGFWLFPTWTCSLCHQVIQIKCGCIQMGGMSVLWSLFCILTHWNLYLKVMLLLDLFIPWIWVMVLSLRESTMKHFPFVIWFHSSSHSATFCNFHLFRNEHVREFSELQSSMSLNSINLSPESTWENLFSWMLEV